MASNNISVTLITDVKWDILRHFLYGVEGVCIIVFNTLIVLTIWRHEALRYMKEYVALGASAVADALVAVGTLSASLYRISVWVTHQHLDVVSARFCLLTPHIVFWGLFMAASHLMLVVISVDRLLCAAIPLQYMSFTRRYMFTMVAAAFGSSFAMNAVGYAINWPITQPIRSKVCWSSDALGKAQAVHHLIIAVATLSSIFLYMLVPVFYRLNSVGPAPANPNPNGVDFQKQLTQSTAISCGFTFLCVALPWVAMFVASFAAAHLYSSVGAWMLIVANIDPAVNFYIYFSKLKYFRIGVKALFRNKTLPPLLNNWQETAL